MNEKLLNKIKLTFKKHDIALEEGALENKQAHKMADGLTNQFIAAQDISGKKYLIRINGRLWSPFTRENEDYNLKQLKKHFINTHVIENNIKNGFQICYLLDEKNRFSQGAEENHDLIKKVGASIKKFHKIKDFKNDHNLPDTINNSVKRIRKNKEQINLYQESVMKILSSLNSDKENHVFSHNDLLPSSVYVSSEKFVSFVDWEYAGRNHRSYDLAFFSIKSSLSAENEERLVEAYGQSGEPSMKDSVIRMKPIIAFIFLVWNLSSEKSDPTTSNFLSSYLIKNLQDAIWNQSIKLALNEPEVDKPIENTKNSRITAFL